MSAVRDIFLKEVERLADMSRDLTRTSALREKWNQEQYRSANSRAHISVTMSDWFVCNSDDDGEAVLAPTTLHGPDVFLYRAH